MPSLSLIVGHVVALAVLCITGNGAANFKDIHDALSFYGVYHRDPINQLIHFFGVPCIIWSLLVFLSHLKFPLLHSLISVNIPLAPKHPINYATIITIGYIIFYIKLDPFGGTLYTPFAYFLYITAVSIKERDQAKSAKAKNIYSSNKKNSSWVGTGRALKIAFLVHFLGWYVQIHPGHGIYEGAKPAITESIGGALTSAPLFAYYEGLWYVGLNKALQKETKALVDVHTKELCDKGAVMRACSNYT
mmetsp:Transcript_6756/g.8552  ORF Transcript_6756/g.8552 Transcript_6756/m.8552 type:complete len:247 (-) Transcript_6756:67-807(-)